MTSQVSCVRICFVGRKCQKSVYGLSTGYADYADLVLKWAVRRG